MIELSPEHIRLLREPNLAHVATLMKDGRPQTSPVWVDFDGTHVLINTATGRQKPRNIERDPRVALSVVDREWVQRYVEIRGRVVEMTTEGAFEHYAMLARKYAGPKARPREVPGESRLIVRIEPEHVTGMNLGPRTS
jgi:PPOX class probable F420-dependent enzyme